MSKKTTIQKTSAMVLLAMMCAAPVQASETGLSNWVKSLFGMSASGVGGGGGNPGVDPAMSGAGGGGGNPGVDPAMSGAGGGGGNPGVDPVLSTTGAGGGGGDPGVKPG